jgi:hypothetical protein
MLYKILAIISTASIVIVSKKVCKVLSQFKSGANSDFPTISDAQFESFRTSIKL